MDQHGLTAVQDGSVCACFARLAVVVRVLVCVLVRAVSAFTPLLVGFSLSRDLMVDNFPFCLVPLQKPTNLQMIGGTHAATPRTCVTRRRRKEPLLAGRVHTCWFRELSCFLSFWVCFQCSLLNYGL